MKRAVVAKYCVACGECLKVCPKNAIDLSSGIKAEVSESCVGCGLCAKDCPADAIEIRDLS